MIRSYTVNELEQISGCTRRTISDYISKGVLSGPSHRGRGARYAQKDLDVLTVLPRIRTLMKKEYPTLKEVSAFLDDLSVRDINRLAARVSEEAFVGEIRRLRVRNSLMNLVPYVAPERIESLLTRFTPGQIRGIDSGRYQIGAVMDIEALLHEENQAHQSGGGQQPGANNGYEPLSQHSNPMTDADRGTPDTESSWSVSWLNGHEEGQGSEARQPWDVTGAHAPDRDDGDLFTDTTTDLDELRARADETQPEMPAVTEAEATGTEIKDRLAEIAHRLEKLESILDKA
jgi:DNA-binding transcriptional MerR regulator